MIEMRNVQFRRNILLIENLCKTLLFTIPIDNQSMIFNIEMVLNLISGSRSQTADITKK